MIFILFLFTKKNKKANKQTNKQRRTYIENTVIYYH